MLQVSRAGMAVVAALVVGQAAVAVSAWEELL